MRSGRSVEADEDVEFNNSIRKNFENFHLEYISIIGKIIKKFCK